MYLNMRGGSRVSVNSFSKRTGDDGDDSSGSGSRSSKRQRDPSLMRRFDFTKDEAARFEFLQRVIMATPEFQALKPLDNKKHHTDRVIRERLGPRKGVVVYEKLLSEGIDMAQLVLHVSPESSLMVFLHMESPPTWWDLIDYFIEEFEDHISDLRADDPKVKSLLETVLRERINALQAYRKLLFDITITLPDNFLSNFNAVAHDPHAPARTQILQDALVAMLRYTLRTHPLPFWRVFWDWAVIFPETDQLTAEQEDEMRAEIWRQAKGNSALNWQLTQAADPRLTSDGALEPRKRTMERTVTFINEGLVLSNPSITRIGIECVKAFRELTQEHHVLSLTRDCGINFVRSLVPEVIREISNKGTCFLMPKGSYRRVRPNVDEDDDNDAVAVTSSRSGHAAQQKQQSSSLSASVQGMSIIDAEPASHSVASHVAGGSKFPPGYPNTEAEEINCLRFLEEVIEKTSEFLHLPDIHSSTNDTALLVAHLGETGCRAYTMVSSKVALRDIVFNVQVDSQLHDWVQRVMMQNITFSLHRFTYSILGVIRALILHISKSTPKPLFVIQVQSALQAYEELLHKIIPGYFLFRNSASYSRWIQAKIAQQSPVKVRPSAVLTMVQNAYRFCTEPFWTVFWSWAVLNPYNTSAIESRKVLWETTAETVYLIVFGGPQGSQHVAALRGSHEVSDGLNNVMSDAGLWLTMSMVRPVGRRLMETFGL